MDLGSWAITVESPMGARKSTLKISEDGGRLLGTMASEDGEGAIEDGKFDSGAISWKMKVEKPVALTLAFDGTLDGDQIEGQCKFGMFGKGTFKAVRL